MCAQETRLRRMHEKCHALNKTIHGQGVWQNPHKTRRILVDDKHKVLYCVIPKVGCTSWKQLMVNLTGKQNLGKLQVHGHYINKYGLYYLSTYKPIERRKRLESYLKFIVTRHPFDRLISAYRDKFVHVTHRPDLIKRMKKLFGTIQHPVSFKHFIQFVSLEYFHKGKDKHWERYEDLCFPCEIPYDYIAKLETATEDARYLLNKMTGKSYVNYTLPHTNVQNPGARKGYSRILHAFKGVPNTIMKQIMELYKNDLDVFGYSFDTTSLTASCDTKVSNDARTCC